MYDDEKYEKTLKKRAVTNSLRSAVFCASMATLSALVAFFIITAPPAHAKLVVTADKPNTETV